MPHDEDSPPNQGRRGDKRLFYALWSLLAWAPPARLVFRLRARLCRAFVKGMGRGVVIKDHVRIINPAHLTIGDDATINPECWIVASPGGEISIGRDVMLAPRCFLETMNHNFSDPSRPIRLQGHSSRPIHIGDNVWLGYGVAVLPGVSIGEGAVVGACSVVTKDIPAGAIAVGSPARVIGQRA